MNHHFESKIIRPKKLRKLLNVLRHRQEVLETLISSHICVVFITKCTRPTQIRDKEDFGRQSLRKVSPQCPDQKSEEHCPFSSNLSSSVVFHQRTVPNLEPHFSPNNFQIETHPKTLSQSHPSINSHRNPCLFHLPTLPSGIQNLGFFYLPKLRPLITLSRILDFAPNPTFGKARVLRSPIHYWFIYFNLGSSLIRKSKSFHFLFMFL